MAQPLNVSCPDNMSARQRHTLDFLSSKYFVRRIRIIGVWGLVLDFVSICLYAGIQMRFWAFDPCDPLHCEDPERYLTQLLTNLSATPISKLPDWLPDAWN